MNRLVTGTLSAGQVADNVNLLSAYPNPYYGDNIAVDYQYVLSGSTIENDTLAYYSNGDEVANGVNSPVEIRGGGSVVANITVTYGQLAFNNYGAAETATDIVISGSDPLSNKDFPVVDVDATTTVNGGSATLGEIDNFGGTVNGFTVSSAVLDNTSGADDAIRLINGGIEEVVNAQTTGAMVEAGGVQMVEGTSLATNDVVSSGGSVVATYGGVLSNTLVLSGGNVSVGYGGGLLSGIVVQAGGNVSILANGSTSSNTTVNGLQLAGAATLADGFTSALTVTAGGVDTVTGRGVTVNATLLQGATEVLTNGGTASSTTVNAGAVQIVSSGGSGLKTEVKSGATEQVAGGGVLSGAHVAAGATLTDLGSALGIGVDGVAYVSGVISGGAVNSGGVINVYGAASGVAVQGGGVLFIAGTGSGNVVNAGGSEVVDGVARDTILAGGDSVIQANGLALAPVVSANAHEQVLSGGVISGPTITNGGMLELAGGAITSGTITFTTPGGTLALDTDTAPSVPLSGFVPGDAIDFLGQPYMPAIPVVLGDLVTVNFGPTTVTLDIPGASSDGPFLVVRASDGSAALETVACYARGTLIGMPDGEMAVEQLRRGDPICTAFGQVRSIRWIGRRSYAGRFLAGNPGVQPINFHAGSLGDGLPRRDLLVSPEHAMFVNGLLIPARYLVNARNIIQESGLERVDYFHVELDSHDVLLAEGAPSESFIDDNSRGMFHNAQEFATLYPGQVRTPAVYCGRRVESGEELAAIKRVIDLRAGLAVPGHDAPLRGRVDEWDGVTLSGWAQNPDHPDAPICLEVIVDGNAIVRVVANLFRPDLLAAGLGSGCHSFRVKLPKTARGSFAEVRRVLDGTLLGALRLNRPAQARRRA